MFNLHGQHELLKQHDKVYYVGDSKNEPAWCKVLCVHQINGQITYDLLRIDHNDVVRDVRDNHIGREHKGKMFPGFVTEQAYNAYHTKG